MDTRRRLAELERRFDALVNAVIPIGVMLLEAKDFPCLLEAILKEAQGLCRADGGTLYLQEGDQLRFAIVRNDSLGLALGGKSGAEIPFPPLPLHDESGAPNRRNVATCAALTGQLVNVPDAYAADGFEFAGTIAFDRRTGYRSRSFLTVPLRNHGDHVIGVLQLLNALDRETGEVIPFDPGFHPVIEALASLAGAALEVSMRQEEMRQQIQALHIQIDEVKRARRVSEITDSEYFRRLQRRARELRGGEGG